ncbi:hypothetical protein AAFF_G00000750 [Aldrovandia affinis]|uniref:Uncharacterized protein n=1 Tax=Aldrovandia affinis TaxID=143900 RepID=A0AAD7TCV5_9TELE|nr:hypothetical protein AAFF_G00000750 [Aldrovandia affinis]
MPGCLLKVGVTCAHHRQPKRRAVACRVKRRSDFFELRGVRLRHPSASTSRHRTEQSQHDSSDTAHNNVTNDARPGLCNPLRCI